MLTIVILPLLLAPPDPSSAEDFATEGEACCRRLGSAGICRRNLPARRAKVAASQRAGVLGGVKGPLPTVAGLRPPWTPPARCCRGPIG